MTRIIYEVPADDAGWLGGISATLDTRPRSHFSNDQTASKNTSEQAMARRMNVKRRKRAANINMAEFWRLHAQGVGVADMADALGVSTRTVDRAMTVRRPYG